MSAVPFRHERYAIFGNTVFTDNAGGWMSMDEWYRAVKRNEDVYDRLTLEMCQDMRSKKEIVPDWLLDAERAAWERSRGNKL